MLYLNMTIQNPKGINLTKQNSIKTILFADNQVLLAEFEDDLQRSVTFLIEILKEHNMKISPEKTKSIAMHRRYTRGEKIVDDNHLTTWNVK